MNLSKNFKKTVIWVTGYLNLIAFLLAGGYIFVKSEEEDVRSSAKSAFLLVVTFTAIDIVRMIVYNIMSVANAGYKALSVVSDIGTVVAVIEALAFVIFFILDLCGIKFIPVRYEEKKAETKE